MAGSTGDGGEATILVVDDSAEVLSGLSAILRQKYSNVLAATSAEEALEVLSGVRVDLVITDLAMPGMDGLELLGRIRRGQPETLVIVVTGYASIETAVDAMKRGAYHYVAKPFRPEEILIQVEHALQRISLERELRRLRSEARQAGSESDAFAGIVAQSKKMHDVFDFVRKVAPTDAPVLIRGESGTGKELIARAIHQESGRHGARFLGINSAALPEQLLEAELFGHKKGAFTGATADKKGLLSSARGGTVFLDEISRMPAACQAKLLRAIEEGEVLPVGGLEAEDIDVRFLSATNAGELSRIREDLYFRLSVMEVTIPPLRDRMEDVAPLATHFVQRYAAKFGLGPRRLSGEAVEELSSYRWPGNVRELENVIQRAVVVSAGETITAGDIWIRSRTSQRPFLSEGALPAYEDARDRALSNFQRRYVATLLQRSAGNVSKAARMAGISRAALYGIMKRNNIKREKQWEIA